VAKDEEIFAKFGKLKEQTPVESLDWTPVGFVYAPVVDGYTQFHLTGKAFAALVVKAGGVIVATGTNAVPTRAA